MKIILLFFKRLILGVFALLTIQSANAVESQSTGNFIAQSASGEFEEIAVRFFVNIYDSGTITIVDKSRLGKPETLDFENLCTSKEDSLGRKYCMNFRFWGEPIEFKVLLSDESMNSKITNYVEYGGGLAKTILETVVEISADGVSASYDLFEDFENGGLVAVEVKFSEQGVPQTLSAKSIFETLNLPPIKMIKDCQLTQVNMSLEDSRELHVCEFEYLFQPIKFKILINIKSRKLLSISANNGFLSENIGRRNSLDEAQSYFQTL